MQMYQIFDLILIGSKKFDEISNEIYNFSEKYFSNPFAGYLLFGVILAVAMIYIRGNVGK